MLLPMFLSKCKTAVPSGTNLGSILENITIVSGTQDRPTPKPWIALAHATPAVVILISKFASNQQELA